MDSQQIRNLQEAYLGVYDNLDEAYTPGPTQAEIRSREKEQRAKQVASAANQSGYGDKPSTDWKLRVTPSSILKKKSGETETVSQRMNRSHDYKNRLTGEMGRKYGSRQAAEVTRTIEGPGEPQSVTYPRKTKPSLEIVRKNLNNSYDLYDVILSHLLDEGYAETLEQAEVIMVNMSEDWRDSICEEYKELRLQLGKMMRKVQKRATREADTRAEIEYDPTFPTMKALKAAEKASRENKRSATMIKVAAEHSPQISKAREAENRARRTQEG